MTSQRSGGAGRPPRLRTARSRMRVAPSTSGGCALGELLAELEPDREHRVREVADVDVAGGRRGRSPRAMSSSSSPSPAGSTASPKRSRIVPRLRRRNANVTGSATMNSKNARKPLSRKSSRPGGRAAGVADAAARLGAELLDDRPEHRLLVGEVVVERARGERRAARRCRARRPRRSRARRTARGPAARIAARLAAFVRSRLPVAAIGEATARLQPARMPRHGSGVGGGQGGGRRGVAPRGRRHRGRGRAPAAPQDWSLPKGKLDPGETLGAGRAARGRGGDRLPLQARARAPADLLHATRRAARRSCATG